MARPVCTVHVGQYVESGATWAASAARVWERSGASLARPDAVCARFLPARVKTLANCSPQPAVASAVAEVNPHPSNQPHNQAEPGAPGQAGHEAQGNEMGRGPGPGR